MRIRILNLILLMLLAPLTLSSQSKIKMVFRYDDFLLKSKYMNDSILDTFNKFKIPLCIGIVPYDSLDRPMNRLDSAEMAQLKQMVASGELELAFHGYDHKNHSKKILFGHTSRSEFDMTDPDLQFLKLKKGKRVLDSLFATDVKVFIPPFNTYDRNTLKALEKLGVTIISARSKEPAGGKTINFMPATFEEFTGLKEVVARHINDDISIIVYFHPYSFEESSGEYSGHSSGPIPLNRLSSVLEWLKTQNIDFLTFQELSERSNFNVSAYRANSLRFNMLKKVLNYHRLYRYGFIPDKPGSMGGTALSILNILMHIILLLITYFITRFFLRLLKLKKGLVLTLLALAVIPAGVYLFRERYDFSIWMKAIMLATFFCGLVYAVYNHYRRERV